MKDIRSLKKFMAKCHYIAKSKGWYAERINSSLENHMLIVSEVAEASEEVRNNKPSLYIQEEKPEGEAAELADAVIRIFDHCEHEGLPLIEALLLKCEYNKTRPYRHGGKKL